MVNKMDAAIRNITNIEILDILHDCGVSTNKVMIAAIRIGDLEMVKKLIPSMLNIDMRNEYMETPLLVASELHKRDIVKLLLDNGANPNKVDAEGVSPLIYACVYNDKELVDAILDAGANIDDVYHRFGRHMEANGRWSTAKGPAIITCKRNGYPELAQHLLNRGARDVMERE